MSLKSFWKDRFAERLYKRMGVLLHDEYLDLTQHVIVLKYRAVGMITGGGVFGGSSFIISKPGCSVPWCELAERMKAMELTVMSYNIPEGRNCKACIELMHAAQKAKLS